MPRIYDIIIKKRTGGALNRDEIYFVANGAADGSIPDYQLSALLMAIFLVGMNDEETANLAIAMAESGGCADLSSIPGIKADKHSTGGVGDKTTLITAPIAAACGLKIAKMSGRGLGFTGGTIDKLEAIPGFKTDLTPDEFAAQASRIGIALAGQSADLAPADKKLYAIRDLTTTVDSIPLIAASVMSKKIASGADIIALDVKLGSGAFMKSLPDAKKLAETMVEIGRLAGKKTSAVITDMDTPLGNAVGNSLEVAEAAQVLMGKGPEDITELSIILAAHMLVLAGLTSEGDARKRCEDAIKSGAALDKLCEMVASQGGDERYIRDTELFGRAPFVLPFVALESGYIGRMDAQSIGEASMLLGAGRATKDDIIDNLAGIQFIKKTGDKVTAGEAICYMHTSIEERAKQAAEKLKSAILISVSPPDKRPLVFAEISL